MIECWFSEQGFLVQGPKIRSCLLIEDHPDDVYNARWYIFGRMLDALLATGERIEEPVVIHHDSRLVEELKNQLEPINDYGKKSRAYFLSEDSPLLPFLQIKKVNSHTIARMLQSSEQTGSTEVASIGRPNR